MGTSKALAAPVENRRAASTEWVAIADMRVSPAAQRKYNPKDAADIAADFDLEALGYPVLNHRADVYWIVDGQHRVGALKIMGWGDQKIECEVYEGLTEQAEADLFLRRDKRRAINGQDKFRIGVAAGREEETAITAICAGLGLHIGKGADAIQAVATLRKVYTRAGADALGRALLIIRESYGDTGFAACVIEGIGLVIQRYGSDVGTEHAVASLTKAHGGVRGLEQKAEVLKRSTGNPKGACVAAAVVDIINGNTPRGKRKLPSWWRTEA